MLLSWVIACAVALPGAATASCHSFCTTDPSQWDEVDASCTSLGTPNSIPTPCSGSWYWGAIQVPACAQAGTNAVCENPNPVQAFWTIYDNPCSTTVSVPDLRIFVHCFTIPCATIAITSATVTFSADDQAAVHVAPSCAAWAAAGGCAQSPLATYALSSPATQASLPGSAFAGGSNCVIFCVTNTIAGQGWFAACGEVCWTCASVLSPTPTRTPTVPGAATPAPTRTRTPTCSVPVAPVTPGGFLVTRNAWDPERAPLEILWAIPDPASARLHIYDSAGEFVRSLEFSACAEGRLYRAFWDGRNYQDRPVAAGIYLLRAALLSDRNAIVRRVAVVR